MLTVLYQRINGQYDIQKRKTITKKEALHQWYRPGSQETTNYNLQVQCFSSTIIFTSQPNYSITNRASRAFEHYLQLEVSSTSIFHSSATNIFSSSTGVFIEEMRRWDLIKDPLGHLIYTLILLGLWGAQWRSLHIFCLY